MQINTLSTKTSWLTLNWIYKFDSCLEFIHDKKFGWIVSQHLYAINSGFPFFLMDRG